MEKSGGDTCELESMISGMQQSIAFVKDDRRGSIGNEIEVDWRLYWYGCFPWLQVLLMFYDDLPNGFVIVYGPMEIFVDVKSDDIYLIFPLNQYRVHRIQRRVEFEYFPPFALCFVYS